MTKPRVEAALTGHRADGKPLDGDYLTGRPYSDGFAESVEFLRLVYCEHDDVELGSALEPIHSAIWLGSSARSARVEADATSAAHVDAASGYALIFRPAGVRAVTEALENDAVIETVWVMTDSEHAVDDVARALPGSMEVKALYADFFRELREAAEVVA